VEKPRRTGAEESIAYGSIASRNIVDGNIRELLSICDSLNKLCDTLNRLENVLKSKNIQHL
jgi:cell division ATPase FtsA